MKIEIKERISIEDALMHKFFENMNDVNNDTIKYYEEIIEKNRKILEKKYEIIKKFKICVICKRYKNELLKECKNCGNSYHYECKVKKCTCNSGIPE